jgi:hypothetical protein
MGSSLLWQAAVLLPGPSAVDPLVDLGELEAQQSAHPVSREPLGLHPPVDGLLGDTEMGCDVFDADPTFF